MSTHTQNDPFPGVIGTFMGRDALELAVSALNLQRSDVALLPAYLCVEVLKPFLSRCQVVFYDIRPDASIDPSEIEQHLSRHHPKVVLFINYFGFLQPYRAQIKTLCQREGALLIEDCAHSLLTEGSGDTGDWVIYSFRKILPVSDGGGIKANKFSQSLQPRFHSGFVVNVLSFLILMKSALKIRHHAFSRAQLTSDFRGLRTGAHSVETARFYPLSDLARHRMRGVDFSLVVAKRRDDFQFWLDWSTRTECVTPLFDRLDTGVCPMGFPVFARNRDQLKSQLEQKGVFVRTHWHLPDCVGSQFLNSHRLARETLTLPLFHEFDENQRSYVV